MKIISSTKVSVAARRKSKPQSSIVKTMAQWAREHLNISCA